MADSTLYQRYNTDNVFNRVVIAGLLYLLNNAIKYEQIFDDNVVETVGVPFAYDFGSSDERFAQDNYTFFGRECFSDKMIDGKFDMLPRFAISYTGSQINSSEITNRFIQAEHMKDENGKLTSYMSYLYSIPLTLNFNCEGWMDNIDTAFKVEQSLRDTFYKNKTFNVQYKGMKIGCCAGFPETTTLEKTTTYSFDNERNLKLSFTLAVETYQPCFDESVEINSANKIEYFGFDINRYDGHNTPNNKKINVSFDRDSMSLGSSLVSGETVRLIWKSSSNVSDMCTMSLYYIDSNDERHQITDTWLNKKYYDWTVPYLYEVYQPEFTFSETDDIKVVESPVIRVVPDSSGYVQTSGIVILNGGEFSNDGSIGFTMEFVDGSGDLNMKTYTGIVSDNKLTSITGGPSSPFFYRMPEKNISISLYIEYPLDSSVFDKIDNLLIL